MTRAHTRRTTISKHPPYRQPRAVQLVVAPALALELMCRQVLLIRPWLVVECEKQHLRVDLGKQAWRLEHWQLGCGVGGGDGHWGRRHSDWVMLPCRVLWLRDGTPVS